MDDRAAEQIRQELERWTDRIRSALPIARALVAGKKVEGNAMAEKLANLGGIASAIDKLTSAIEDDAKGVLARVEGVHSKRARVFGKANERLATRDAALDAADAALDKLDAALGDNGGPALPTSEDSSRSA